MKNLVNLALLGSLIIFISCASIPGNEPVPGAWRMDKYLSILEDMSVGIVANQTSMIGDVHLVDTLSSLGININRIFSPEHGFRGTSDAGILIKDGKDQATGIDIISLYGSNKRLTKEMLKGLDIVIFDIQDVGARFYTYISTLEYLMEACAENGIEILILDRPNPNGFYFDGPVLDTNFRSFVGMQAIPVVHGMTVGEYAGMLFGEKWLDQRFNYSLKVIKCGNYAHKDLYTLPHKPSPNLPDQRSVYLYPTVCFFEGTVLSCGRGTEFPFQVFGHPDLSGFDFSFTPEPMSGASNPKLNGQLCFGMDLRNHIYEDGKPRNYIKLEWIIEAYNAFPQKDKFFTSYFDVLAGGNDLREMIESGFTAEDIRSSWQDDLDHFSSIRSKYLLYKD